MLLQEWIDLGCPLNTLVLGDCMIGMNLFPDKHFQLTIPDPPYGLDMGNYQRTEKDKVGKRYKKKDWDVNIPDISYFNELKRVSENQLIWGGNYYFNILGNSRSLVCWYKHQPVPTYSDCEYCWSSFDRVAKVFDYPYYGNINQESDRIHQTQKPVKLYHWLLKNYAKEGDIILDTHAGSCSSVIACIDFGFDWLAFEIDEDYYNAAIKRIEKHLKRPKPIFNQKDLYNTKIKKLF
jgi:site-specific DNA-methyltransferase (adenine-specific)